MATLLHSESRRLYSWWWDSHISPKNSKWLQENLADMDAKVKAMIKLIEEDADSFARRAEMYYKKRPELMKLVEEFYRAYRALAERYDHATGELRQAHRTMAEVFPNEVPFVLTDDSHPESALLDSDDLHKYSMGLSASDLHGKKGLKQLDEIFEAGEVALENPRLSERRTIEGLKLEKEDNEKEKTSHDDTLRLSDENHNLKNLVLAESERAGKAETEIQNLKNALDNMNSEKEAALLQYHQSVEKLSNLEKELNRAQLNSRGLDEQVRNAAVEVQTLKEALIKLEAERDSGLLREKEFRERIYNMESTISQARKDAKGLNERAIRAETEAQCLEKELSRSETAKDTGLLQYKQCLEKISDLEKKLSLAEEEAKLLNERADSAETEVRKLEKALADLNEEKKAAACQYERCLEKISKLESELSSSQEKIRCLNSVVLMETSKLKSAGEKCVLLEMSNQSLRLEADDLAKKIAMKDVELSEKHGELEKLQASVQKEHLRFVQVEATLHTLQNVHFQSQEQQKSLALELKNGLQMLKEMEICKHGLEDEIQQVKDENRILNELNSSSTISTENLQHEIVRLREMKKRLEEEVRLQMGQSNSLQQEIYDLKEDIRGLNERYQTLVEQVKSVGLNPAHVGSSVKDLQDENSKLRQICKENRDEKEAIFNELDNMNRLLENNAVLESSLKKMSAELDGSREKVGALQESCQLLHGEKSALAAEKAALLSQLQIITGNMQKLLEKNIILENSLSRANVELEGLRVKSKSLEELCNLLNNDKSALLTERGNLVVQLGNVEWRLESLERRFSELEEKYDGMEKDKAFMLSQVEELKVSLGVEKQERASVTLLNETRLSCLENLIQILQEESRWRKKQFEEELDRAANAQFEIFILQMFIQDMEQKNYSLLNECQKHIEASKLAEKLISELESENLEQQVEAELLLHEIKKLRMGIYRVFEAIDVGLDNVSEEKISKEQVFVHHALENIEDMKSSLSNYEDDRQKLLVENSVLLTLLEQLRLDGVEIESEKELLEHEFKIMADHHSKVLEENRSLLKNLLDLKEEIGRVEKENDCVIMEAISLDSLLMIFKNFGTEKSLALKLVSEDLQNLCGVKSDLDKEVGVLSRELEMQETENLLLKDSVKKLEEELRDVREFNNQLKLEISSGQNLLYQKERALSEAEQKLNATENLNSELCRNVEGLKRQHEESILVKGNLEKGILELYEENTSQKKEIECLREANGNLEFEMDILREEIEEHRIREENLSSELQEISNEFEIGEAEAASFHFDLQISTIREVLFENKVRELTGACETLAYESSSKTVEIEQMKERVSFMETEIRVLKYQLFAYAPVIDSLRDSIASLEHNILSQPGLSMADNQELKDTRATLHLHEKSSQDLIEGKKSVIPNGIRELQNLQARLKAVEEVVTQERERRAMQEDLDTNIRVEASLKEIEDLKSIYSFSPEKDKQKWKELGDGPSDKLTQRTKPEFSEVRNGILMKDIPLDHVSDGSLRGISRRRRNHDANDQMLELWETAEDDFNPNQALKDSNKQSEDPSSENDTVRRQFKGLKQKNKDPSLELQAEKELGVDKLAVTTSFTEINKDRNKRKILERLDSDAQKLKCLQTTVEELIRKLETTMSKTRKKAKNVDSNIDIEMVKEQLQEVEETILQLVEVNGQLTETIELSEGKASVESEEGRNVQRKSVLEQARNGSEKIGWLQLEVQKLQYVLLKLDDEKKSRGKSRFSRNRTTIVLRDFIYRGERSSPKPNKPCLCGCFRAPTIGDGNKINVLS
ncbi:hypothetical protein U1Q18_031253 [Sarracenia purpurea var. burkii]